MRLFVRWLGAVTGKSIADVTGRKGRTLLISLGIFISVAGLMAIVAFLMGVREALAPLPI